MAPRTRDARATSSQTLDSHHTTTFFSARSSSCRDATRRSGEESQTLLMPSVLPKLPIGSASLRGITLPHLPICLACKENILFPGFTSSRINNARKAPRNCNLHQSLGFYHSLKFGRDELLYMPAHTVQPHRSSRISSLVIRNEVPQNADLPRYFSKKEKKPFPVPIVDLRRAARERAKSRKGKPKGPVPPPKNGLLIKRLIPVAYDVLNARVTLINNLRRLLKVVPVHACKWCNEIHVGRVGHPFKSCRGIGASKRRGLHEWTKDVSIEDILPPVESYHLYDRLARRINHEERFTIPRIPAVVELCIQAGIDIPEYPAKRRRLPIIRISRNEFIDADETHLPDPDPIEEKPEVPPLLTDSKILVPTSREEMLSLAEETLEAWERMRIGANRLMKRYQVRVCGYCPEIHVGPKGHKAQNCGAHKHQQRNGQHGWQSAVINDLIPPRYVWHVPNVTGAPLQRELRAFYGQAPAVVEICVQAGAEVPVQYKPTMRLEVGIPESLREAEMVV